MGALGRGGTAGRGAVGGAAETGGGGRETGAGEALGAGGGSGAEGSGIGAVARRAVGGMMELVVIVGTLPVVAPGATGPVASRG